MVGWYRYASGTSGAIIVYNQCTTSGGTLVYPTDVSEYHKQHRRTIADIKPCKMKRPKIAQPINPWSPHFNFKNKIKYLNKKRTYYGCCHISLK